MDRTSFYSEVRDEVRSEVVAAIARIQDELQRISSNKKLHLHAEDIAKSCERMKRLLLGNFKKNLKKFEMYSDENVFSEKSQATRESSASSSEQDIAELQRLRAEFDSERDTYELLTAQKAALGPLLRAMQTSLFELRVAGQIVDSLNLHPLADSVAALSQQVAALEDLCAKSEALTANIAETAVSNSSNMSPGSMQGGMASIASGSAAELEILANAFK